MKWKRERLGTMATECETCGIPFVIWICKARAGEGRYCSYRCAGKRDRRGSKNSNWKGGRTSRADGRSVVYAPGNPMSTCSGGSHVLEYRLIASRKIGRTLTSDDVVHHIDGDIHNNAPSNLKVMSRREHALVHFIGCRRPDKQKITKEQAHRACLEVVSGSTQRSIAKKYGISEGYLSCLVRGINRRN